MKDGKKNVYLILITMLVQNGWHSPILAIYAIGEIKEIDM